MTSSDKERLFVKFNGNTPASADTILRFESESHVCLPNDYAEYLLETNGGEGFIGNSYVMLWRVEDLIEMNKAYQVAEYASGLFLFGSDGGGEAFAFDIRSDAMPIISIPFVGMEWKLVRPVAPNFKAFLEKLFKS